LAFFTESIGFKIQSLLSEKKKIRRVTGMIAVVFLLAGISGMLYKKDHVRSRAFYNDIYLQDIQLPERITISVCQETMIRDEWLFVDMQRFYKISLTPKMGNEYLIVDKNSECNVPQGYQKVHRQPTIKYILYKKYRP
jgi:hypothetical protein